MTDGERVLELAAEKLARSMQGIQPDRVYPPDEAAELIGFRSTRRTRTIKDIPRALLPRIPLTPGGRIVGYLGRDLLDYIQGQRRKAS